GERLRLPIAHRRLPVSPALQALVVESPVERPVGQPVPMLFLEGGELAGTAAAGPQLVVAEPLPRATERRALGGAHRFEIDALVMAIRVEAPPLVVGEVSTQVLDRVEIDVHGLERGRARCRIRAVLARRHLAQGQELPQRRSALAQPPRYRAGVRVAAQAASRPAHARERQEETGPAAEAEAMSHDGGLR